jgi:glycosyltransferase involved in cell wall biosynthesis
MRILISTWSLQVGGGEVLAMNLAAELVRRGHRVFLFNQRAELIDEALVARLLPPAVTVLSMRNNPIASFWAYKINALQKMFGRPASFYAKRQRAHLSKCLQLHRIELISSHATFSDAMCVPVAQRLNIPVVITEHGEYGHFIADGRRDFAPVLLGAQRILTVSKYNQRVLEQALKNLPPVETIYNGVATGGTYSGAAMRQQMAIPMEAFVFGMVARGIENKGWEQAILAFQQFCAVAHQRPVRLVLVGGSEYLLKLQATYAADTNIIFAGQVPNPDFYIAGFDVGLLPTYFRAEALPLAIIEYMTNGKPVIATHVGGISELLQPNDAAAGQLIELNALTHKPNVAAVAQAMVHYYTNSELYAMHAHNARQASQQFSMQVCAAHYEHAFNRVLAGAN